MQPNGQPAVPLALEQLVRPPVPDLDRPRAVLAGGDLALERRVLERVVLDVDGQAPAARLERDPLGDGPAGERAPQLEPEVVVQPSRRVLLDDEDGRVAAFPGAERLGRALRIALPPILAELPRGAQIRALPGPSTLKTPVEKPVDGVENV